MGIFELAMRELKLKWKFVMWCKGFKKIDNVVYLQLKSHICSLEQ